MEVKVRKGWDGWLAAGAIFGLYGALFPFLASSVLGWLGSILGLLPALLLPRYPLPHYWEKALQLVRCLWALEAMALSLGLCARGIAEYNYSGWIWWGPAVLIALGAWRGSFLSPVQSERVGKLLTWLLIIIAGLLAIFTVSRIQWKNLRVTQWGDLMDGLKSMLLTLGAASALIPAGGVKPGLITDGICGGAVAVTQGAEGTALAKMLEYPFLTLCDAAAFQLRLSSLGGAMWAVGECALLIKLLSLFPEGKLVRGVACAAVLALMATLPWAGYTILIFLIAGGIISYLPVLFALMHYKFTGENYI